MTENCTCNPLSLYLDFIKPSLRGLYFSIQGFSKKVNNYPFENTVTVKSYFSNSFINLLEVYKGVNV
tara:strand:+ start:391 stop:591 length:201 start_codon:yes stop_codon:yes gene_type:complete